MFSSLLRPEKRKPSQTQSRTSYFNIHSPTPREPFQGRRAWSRGQVSSNRLEDAIEEDGEEDQDDEQDPSEDEDEDDDQASAEDGDDLDEQDPLLPIFSAAHLDSISVYTVTRSIRELIEQRCETTLTWEQLRSPQISQFLVKPIQQRIRNAYFSRGTLYALLANCLQFTKEGQMQPGNVGVLNTRALCSELLAMRLLKEYDYRELIDALSYDFDPLQGLDVATANYATPNNRRPPTSPLRTPAARTSTLEVAIRAQAKRFIAHPLCVQHLEAIWAGNIVFHSAADSLHRRPTRPPLNTARHYGATHAAGAPQLHGQMLRSRPSMEIVRRSVTLYNTNDASLFKLSRLRVPRYRSFFSTLSYAIMLGLFLAVLFERSMDISALEIVFWVWGAGFMLDEIIGFSEQGFSLYFLSVWNGLDIGILSLFAVYYALRLFSLLIVDGNKRYVANMAYDVLASTAVLLFPRLFSLLDHYRYFSQLLIAFRLMAQDLVAVLVLIGITCSGFFVAFTLSFGPAGYNGATVAYDLFRILMGFTPAAWDAWEDYNILGKMIMSVFLIMCHFLIVTILITVLTNSFMAIVKNANEEHLFLFSINVLSMVKSDALFSYLPPTNVLGWIFSPLRYVLPFRHFVRVNRTIIKATHFPALFLICAYEKLLPENPASEPTEKFGERRGRRNSRFAAFGIGAGNEVLTPTIRVREPSIATHRKDAALEEVFMRPPIGGATVQRSSASQNRQVDNWMRDVLDLASPPQEQPDSVLEQLEVTRRPPLFRSATSAAQSTRRRSSRSMKFSEVEDRPLPRQPTTVANNATRSSDDRDSSLQQTEGEFGDEEDNDGEPSSSQERVVSETQTPPRPVAPKRESGGYASSPATPRRFVKGHNRHASVNTVLYRPESADNSSSSARSRKSLNQSSASLRQAHLGRPGPQAIRRPLAKGVSSPLVATRARPIMPTRDEFQTAPNLARFLTMAQNAQKREPSFDARALDLASDIGDNRPYGADGVGNLNALLSSSFQTRIGTLSGAMQSRVRKKDKEREQESNMMSRMVLARMNTIEEGFKDILKEVKDWRNASSSRPTSDTGGATANQRRVARRVQKERTRMEEALRAAGPDFGTPEMQEAGPSGPRLSSSPPADSN